MKRSNIGKMQKIAKSRNGKCLSACYKNAHSKLRWQCSLGHIWSAIPANITQGKWCPNCKSNHNEERCRFILEQLTGLTFLKTRGIIEGELDGYCEELNVAFEYQGIQHFENVPFFRQSLSEIQLNDKSKREQCQKRGVILIEVPYLIAEKGIDELEKYLRRKIAIVGVVVDNTVIDYSKEKASLIMRVNRMRAKDGLECVNIDRISNGRTYVKMRCTNNHEWVTQAYSVISQNYGCPYCAGKHRTIEDVQIVARNRGGECLSKSYVRAVDKMRWKCSKGHTWLATLNKILNGRWCPKCAQKSRVEQRRLNKGYSYEMIQEMHQQGVSIRDICSQLQICTKTAETAIKEHNNAT